MQKQASQLQEASLVEPVVITYHDRPRLVLMSVHEYDRLVGKDETVEKDMSCPDGVATQTPASNSHGDEKMRPSRALEANREQVWKILRRFDVSNPRVFGSVVRGEDDETSDLDLLVDAGVETTLYDLAQLQSELESVLGCKVDVTTPDGLSTDVMKNAAPDFRPLE